MSASTEQNMSAEGPQETVRFKNERALIWVLDIGIAICVWQLFQAMEIIPYIIRRVIATLLPEHVSLIFDISSEVAVISIIAVAVGAIVFVWRTVWQRAVVSYRSRFFGLLWSGSLAYIILLLYQLLNDMGVHIEIGCAYDYIVLAMWLVILWSCVALLPLLCQWRRQYGISAKQLMISCLRAFIFVILYNICVAYAQSLSYTVDLPFMHYSITVALLFVGIKLFYNLCIFNADKSMVYNADVKKDRPDIVIWLCFWCMAESMFFINKNNENYLSYSIDDHQVALGLSILSLMMTIFGLLLTRKFVLNYSINVVVGKGAKVAGVVIFLILIIDVFQCYVIDVFHDLTGKYSIIYAVLLIVRSCIIRILLGGIVAVVIGTLGDQRYRSLENNEVMPLTCSMFILGVVFNYAGYFHTLHVDYIDPYYKILFIASACGLLYRLRVRRRQREAIAVPR